MNRRIPIAIAALALALALSGCDYQNYDDEPEAVAPEGAEVEGTEATEDRAEELGETVDEAAEAEELVQEAATVARQLQADPEIGEAFAQAKAILIAPDYGEVAAGVGVRGGEAVLVARTQDGWSPPVFYDIGSISIGAQLGATGGDIAMLIMSDDVLNNFNEDQNFSLDADAGFTLVDFSAQAQESWGKGEDVVFWSDTEGAFAGVSLGATDIDWDDEENPAYYGQSVTPRQILNGEIQTTKGGALTTALSG